MTRETYKGYIIETGNYAPFEFCHESYDGPGDNRLGTGKTIEDCKEQIDTLIDDEPVTLSDVRYERAAQIYAESHGDAGL